MRSPNMMILVVGGLLSAVASSANGDISVGNTDFSNENVGLATLGATTATFVSSGGYSLSHNSGVSEFNRPIVPFLRSDFAAVGSQGCS